MKLFSLPSFQVQPQGQWGDPQLLDSLSQYGYANTPPHLAPNVVQGGRGPPGAARSEEEVHLDH